MSSNFSGADPMATWDAAETLTAGAQALADAAGSIDVESATASIAGSQTATFFETFDDAARRALTDASHEMDVMGVELDDLAENIWAATNTNRSSP